MRRAFFGILLLILLVGSLAGCAVSAANAVATKFWVSWRDMNRLSMEILMIPDIRAQATLLTSFLYPWDGPQTGMIDERFRIVDTVKQAEDTVMVSAIATGMYDHDDNPDTARQLRSYNLELIVSNVSGQWLISDITID